MASADAPINLPPQQEQHTEKPRNGCEWDEIEENDDNMLIRLEWNRLQEEFFDYLQTETTTIEKIVPLSLFHTH
jgi:hypothetical protein